ncbi:hypothetical protein [Dyella sp.]|jgi:hypothetical protein|uniref:hypothetical protein n=1 Tax=Dyella sp. TaxID=1869338 RepID=UPI002FD8B782
MALKRNGTIFNPGALVDFLLTYLILGVLISLRSRTIDNVSALLWLAFLCVSSIVLLWQRWKRPEEFKHMGMSQLAVLPRKWRNRVLDESETLPLNGFDVGSRAGAMRPQQKKAP